MNSTLVNSKNSKPVTREQLSRLAEPTAESEHHLPVAHHALVDAIEASLQAASLSVSRWRLQTSHKDQRLFGVADLATQDGQWTAAVGFAHANDRSLSLRLVAGLRVLVCDNLCLHGDMIALKRKHTLKLNLQEEVQEGINRYLTHAAHLATRVAELKEMEIDTQCGDSKILSAFVGEDPILPLKTLPAVVREWRAPSFTEFRPRTLWSLHNAFTENLRELSVERQLAVTTRLGKLFGLKEAQ